MIAGWKWLPNSKGLVSGTVLMGFGLGGFIFNLLGTKLANPMKLNIKNGLFPNEVYQNFPKMLRTLSIIYAILVFTGASFITEPKPIVTPPLTSTTKHTAKVMNMKPVVVPTDVSVIGAIKTKQFWLLWVMIICSASASLNVATLYKRFATGIYIYIYNYITTLILFSSVLFDKMCNIYININTFCKLCNMFKYIILCNKFD